MTIKTLMAGAAMLALCAGAAHATTHTAGGTYAEPSQPVAYSKLNAYLKASPSHRAKGDWGLAANQTASAAAPTGTPVNASATAPAMPDQSAMPSAAPADQGAAMPSQAAPMQGPTDQTPPAPAPAAPQ
jgi:hypothetical protein